MTNSTTTTDQSTVTESHTEIANRDRRVTDKGLGGRVFSMEERLDNTDKTIEKIEKELEANTRATKEILEIVTMGKSFFKVLKLIGNFVKWTAGIAAPIVAIYVAWKQAFNS